MSDGSDSRALREKLEMYRRLLRAVTDSRAQKAIEMLMKEIEESLQRATGNAGH